MGLEFEDRLAELLSIFQENGQGDVNQFVSWINKNESPLQDRVRSELMPSVWQHVREEALKWQVVDSKSSSQRGASSSAGARREHVTNVRKNGVPSSKKDYGNRNQRSSGQGVRIPNTKRSGYPKASNRSALTEIDLSEEQFPSLASSAWIPTKAPSRSLATESRVLAEINTNEQKLPTASSQSSGVKPRLRRRITPNKIVCLPGKLSAVNAKSNPAFQVALEERTQPVQCEPFPPASSLPVVTAPSTPVQLEISENKEKVEEKIVVEELSVDEKDLLCKVAQIYAACVQAGLVVNVFAELYLLVQLLHLTSQTVSSSKKEEEENPGQLDKLLSSAGGCTFFAVSTLEQLVDFLLQFDGHVLRLLAGHPKVQKISKKFAEKLLVTANLPQPVYTSALSSQQTSGVSFQEGRDSQDHFPDQRAFHAFKKQRNVFCRLMREWESTESQGKTSLAQESLSKHVRDLLDMQLANTLHFARYFVLQLLQTCVFSPNSWWQGLAEKDISVLRRAGDSKLQLLQRKLMEVSKCGTCPLPSFPCAQEFFRTFIMAAAQASLPFFYHLQGALADKIIELNSSLSSGKCDVELQQLQVVYEETVEQLMLLAKFLGFMISLPARQEDSVPRSLQVTVTAYQQWWPCPPLDLHLCLSQAAHNSHLCLTVPWIVSFFATLGTLTRNTKAHQKAFFALISLHRDLFLVSASRTRFFLLLLLGWLFELLGSSFVTAKASKEVSFSNQSVLMARGLDSEGLVSADFLHSSCPFVYEIERVLTSFGHSLQSSSRRINPLCEAKPKAVITHKVLGEAFLTYQHPVVREVVQFVSNRMISQTKQKILNSLASVASDCCHGLQHWFKQQRNVVAMTIESLVCQKKVTGLSELVLEELWKKALPEIAHFCQDSAKQTLKLLLEVDFPEPVLAAAASIVCKEATGQVEAWHNSSVPGLVKKEVCRLFDRARNLAVTAVSATLSAFENENDLSSLSTLPTYDVMQVLARRLFAGSFSDVLQAVPHQQWVPVLTYTSSRLVRHRQENHAALTTPCHFYEVLPVEPFEDIACHSLGLALAVVGHHVEKCHNHSKGCDELGLFVAACAGVWFALKDFEIKVPVEGLPDVDKKLFHIHFDFS